MKTITFYFDLGSPYAYLAATRIEAILGANVRWQPILLGALMKRNGDISWAHTDQREAHEREIKDRIVRYGLPPMHVHPTWPSNYLIAMRGAIAAQRQNQIKTFALTAYRMAFVEALDLSQMDVVLEAGKQSGLDIDRFTQDIQSAAIKEELRTVTEHAGNIGVPGVPTVVVDGKIYFGDDQLEQVNP